MKKTSPWHVISLYGVCYANMQTRQTTGIIEATFFTFQRCQPPSD